MVIKNKVLDHKGGFYFYRIHEIKIKKLCDKYVNLKLFLENVFKNCPDSYFNHGPRASNLRIKLKNLKLYKVRGHEICELAKIGLKKKKSNNNHLGIQAFMLERDNKTIAVEVPIWLEKYESNKFYRVFKTNEQLTGHIDILRVEDGKIWVWDYKPNAIEEKYASTQVYFYAFMLSKRTGIKLDDFGCGYFDEKVAFLFKPSDEVKIDKQLDFRDFYLDSFTD